MNGLTEKSHLQNKKSIITSYIISRNALDAFYYPFSACQVIHAWFEQGEPFQRSLNFFCGNEYFKHVIDGKVDMKLSY